MRLGNETAGFIKQHKDSTFFAFLSCYAVHAPIQTTNQNNGRNIEIKLGKVAWMSGDTK